ncbi:MAG: heavy metal translocating P-type ATPase [Candidatus Harrisonbacteria bacterium]|nr:heavy metal translocating P-type ATPase [Candidatus Harrisonbacteria bacterium]
MHPEVRQEKPGLCPECGMNLVPMEIRIEGGKPVVGEAGFDKHAGHSTNIFRMKFLISLLLTIPVVLYSELPEKVFGYTAPAFPFSQYVGALLGSIVFFYAGWLFLQSAYRELRAKLPGMMTLIAIAIIAAYAYSAWVTLFGGPHTLYWELTTLITVMLLGHWIEMRAVQGAQGALKELAKLLPDTAEVVRDGKTEVIPLTELRVGDIVLVRPGAKIPADGAVTEGVSDVNESLMTGEAKPVKKTVGMQVIAGSSNGDGALHVRVASIGEHTFLAGVMRLVADAQASKSRLQLLADRAAYYLTIVAVAGGTLTLVAWTVATGDVAVAIERFVAVLVIACPHALGLAIPLVASISTTLGARGGLLVRERRALEAARNIDIVLFDKTGTLTKGEFGVEKIIVGEKSGIKSSDELLRLAASVDAHSEHFTARAIVSAARERKLNLLQSKDFRRIAGKGVSANIGGLVVYSGNEALMAEAGMMIPDELRGAAGDAAKAGKTGIYVGVNTSVLGVMLLADIIRDESRESIAALSKMGVKVAMMTGDTEDVAAWVAKELGIAEYFARVLPGGKAEKVKVLQDKGLRVAMVGDGINDAPALTQADLGIAIGAGTNVAIESAGIILVRNDPRDIPRIIRLSRLTYRKMLQNLFWATGYNVVAMPLAAGVLAGYGIILQPAVSALLMSVSTVVVAGNAVLMRWKKI